RPSPHTRGGEAPHDLAEGLGDVLRIEVQLVHCHRVHPLLVVVPVSCSRAPIRRERTDPSKISSPTLATPPPSTLGSTIPLPSIGRPIALESASASFLARASPSGTAERTSAIARSRVAATTSAS